MAGQFNKLKIKMDGQEHELSNYELVKETNSIMLDFEHSVLLETDDPQKLFDKDVEVFQVGCDDDYVKAKIDSFFIDNETNNKHLLSLSIK